MWAATGEPLALPATLGAGVLVDLDHSPDMWWTLALRRRPIAAFVLHGWELLAGLIVFGVWAGFPWWLVAVVVGYGGHMITDQMFNRGGILSYSFLYRARHGFQLGRLEPGWNFDDSMETLRAELPPAAWLVQWWWRRSGHRYDGAREGEVGRAFSGPDD